MPIHKQFTKGGSESSGEWQPQQEDSLEREEARPYSILKSSFPREAHKFQMPWRRLSRQAEERKDSTLQMGLRGGSDRNIQLKTIIPPYGYPARRLTEMSSGVVEAMHLW